MNQTLELKSIDEQETSQSLHFRQQKYGHLIPLCSTSRRRPKFFLGPHYPLFLTALIVCSSLIGLMLYNYFQLFALFWKIIVLLSGGGFVFSFIWVGISQPGIVLPQREATQLQKQDHRFCNICQIIKERRTEHCEDCDICIAGYDHHCPWVGKCVGRDNLSAFYTFLIMTFGNMVICFVATSTINIGQGNFPKPA